MRLLLPTLAVLLSAAPAFAQNCPNGTCPNVRYAYPQSFTSPQQYAPAAQPQSAHGAFYAVSNEGNVIYRKADGSLWMAPKGAACPTPAPVAPKSPFQISADVSPTPSLGNAVDGLDEVNAKRAQRGLPPFARDDNLTQGAAACAQARASRLSFGHTANDQAFLPPGTACSATGCAAYAPSYGWMSCCTFDSYRVAGAAWAMGVDGKRYMSLFVR